MPSSPPDHAQSGLVVEIPEAEPAVARHRAALDVNEGLGVPAHVTVLFPFIPPARVDAEVLDRLRRLFADVAAFEVDLTHTAWFDEDVLWLAPDDPKPFRALTELVHREFPEFPPFAGQFADVVPHLTVAHGCDVADMRAAERAVAQHLPIHARITTVTLLVQPDPGGAWTRAAGFGLAGTA